MYFADNLGKAAVVIVVLLCISLLTYIILRRLRIRYDEPRYVPTAFLKAKWTAWLPSPVKKRYSSSLVDRRSIQERRSPSPANTLQRLRYLGVDNAAVGESTTHDGEPNRHASIRSIMTLPSYTADPRANEQILGREGERSGMDTVVEFPETHDEEETRREQEMESLYQIRVRRREERAAREERRRLRREARARGDRQAIEALRQESRRARSPGEGNQTATELLEEHRSKDRGRRFASVEYASLGVARHDGSRVRANSNESDRPLLSSAASMASRHQGAGLANGSNVTLATTRNGHTHNQSSSSLSRFTTNAADVSDYDTDDASDVERSATPYGNGRRSTSTVGRSAFAARSSVDLGSYSMDNLPSSDVPIPPPPGYEESLRATSTDQIARPDFEQVELNEDAQGASAGQSSYSRGRRFGLPRGWGGRKQTRDEEQTVAGREMSTVHAPRSVSVQSATRSMVSAVSTLEREEEAPPYSSPVTEEAPHLPALMTLPSIEITPFTPVEGVTRVEGQWVRDEGAGGEGRAWPL